ncbi:DUF6090 family protein [Balneola sp. MJW-20]|uniref:DUF6090 family protein n=1 Tax=Gracilimonas aurantiaca TaxID=3234185 RepID=UPI00346750EE
MEQNKTRTYVLYAFGEIALVMIGILLALQVNNWNEERKTQREERILLENLKTDFETRLTELKEFSEAREEIISNIHRIAGMIREPETILPDEEMNRIMATQNNLLLFNDQFKILDILFSTGKIDNISDKQLKTLLLQWPQHVEEMMEEQRLRQQIASERLQPLQYQYLSYREVMENFNFRGYQMARGVPRLKEPDYRGLLSDPQFENYLAHVELLHTVNENDYETLIRNAEKIIELLESKLEG